MLLLIILVVLGGVALIFAQDAQAKAKDAIQRIHPPFTRRNE